MAFQGFMPAAFTFLRGLAKNNNRAWFEARREIYETEVRGPMKALVEEMDVRFARFGPEIIGDPKRAIFRINRDIRFSRDKSPYKTHAACWFNHGNATRQVGQDAEAGSAGFYFHLQPGSSFLGAGIWMPPRGQLGKIRDALAEAPRGFAGVVESPAVKRRYGKLEDESMLTRLPRGYEPGHPAEKWLRYQSFTLGRSMSEKEVLGTRLPQILERDYKALLPLVRWLNAALGYKPASRR
jgi:uncharacterized protein (TIGR02453 family)